MPAWRREQAARLLPALRCQRVAHVILTRHLNQRATDRRRRGGGGAAPHQHQKVVQILCGGLCGSTDFCQQALAALARRLGRRRRQQPQCCQRRRCQRRRRRYQQRRCWRCSRRRKRGPVSVGRGHRCGAAARRRHGGTAGAIQGWRHRRSTGGQAAGGRAGLGWVTGAAMEGAGGSWQHNRGSTRVAVRAPRRAASTCACPPPHRLRSAGALWTWPPILERRQQRRPRSTSPPSRPRC